jgi:uncharacterized glyoxalase superfamily protein PhnB
LGQGGAVWFFTAHLPQKISPAPADQFYGDRSAGVKDPVGNRWWIATHKEDLSPEELAKRAEVFMQQQH